MLLDFRFFFLMIRLPPRSTRTTHSFPTRRSSDLAGIIRTPEGLKRLLDDPHPIAQLIGACALAREESRGAHFRTDFPERDAALDGQHAVVRDDRSEEHTSELQSLMRISYAVFCLKKKKQQRHNMNEKK